MAATTFPGKTAPNGKNPASQGGGTVVNVESQGMQTDPATGMLVPFSRATKLRVDSGRTITGTMSTATNQVSFSPLPTTGYLSAMYLQVVLTTAANAAAVAFNADAPWNFFRQIQFKTPDGTPIVNGLTGYQAFLAAKWGAYRLGRPEGSALAFSTTSGAVGAGGSFTLVLPIYAEFARDCMGLLANMDASAAYQLDLTIGVTADLYSVAPTNAGTYVINLYLESYSNPPDQVNGQQAKTEPPALGSTQFWTVQNYSWSGTGEQTFTLNRTGNLLRNLILVFRTAAGVRSATVFPTGNLRIELDQMTLQNENVLQNQFKTYRYATYDLDTGLYLIAYTFDPDDVLTAPYGDAFLPTYTQTKYAIIFTPGVAGSLEVIENDVAPNGDIYVG